MNQETNSNPSVIARETLRQLAILKISPTPDSYHKLYDQIAGNPDNQIPANNAKMLAELAKEFPRHTPALLNCANSLEQAASERNWSKYKSILIKFITAEVTTLDNAALPIHTKSKPAFPWGVTIGNLFKELDSKPDTPAIARKRESFKRILDGYADNPEHLHSQLNGLIDSWKASASISPEMTGEDQSPLMLPIHSTGQDTQPDHAVSEQEYGINSFAGQLLELLAQLLENIFAYQINDQAWVEETKRLAHRVREIQDKQEMEQFIAHFQQFCVRLEARDEKDTQLQQGLLRLLNLLMDSTGELLAEDQWIKEQLSQLKKAMSNPLNMEIITQAEHSLGEIAQRQEKVKHNLGKARMVMRQMATSLISNLEELSDATGEYHDKLSHYSEQINHTDDIEGINQLLAEIMQETRTVQKSVLNYRNDLLSTRAKVDEAHNQINQLENKLLEMGEKVHEDHLTGILNRRGFDNAYKLEVAHATHHRTPLCFALLDIDNFKQLNDTHGHHVGDYALIYLVEAVKETVRRSDVISRYGGEEFTILLPDTALKEAISTIARIRRYLTKKFFLHENKRLLITFSAGVTQYQAGESQEDLFKRADEALYRAKKNGKNQIVAAE